MKEAAAELQKQLSCIARYKRIIKGKGDIYVCSKGRNYDTYSDFDAHIYVYMDIYSKRKGIYLDMVPY